MKKVIFVLVLAAAGVASLAAQADFSGTAKINFAGNIPGGDYDSILNPGNMLGVNDLSMSSSLIAKLDGGGDKSTFSAWFSLKQYPIGQGLMAATTSPATVYDFVKGAGDTVYNLELMRLSSDFYLGDNVSVTVGRQSMLTGYGYGWNPIDFANPLKNPAEPDAELKGVDGVTVGIYPGSSSALKVYAVLPDDPLISGTGYKEVKAGSELTLYLPGVETKLAGFWDYDSSQGSDAYTPAAGAAFMVDVFGAGVYSEMALRKGSRNYFTNGMGSLERKTDWLFSGLAGVQYQFKSEVNLVMEYFYNGEGFNRNERSSYKDTVILFGTPSSDLFGMYSPGYFARHYILMNLAKSLYNVNTDLNFSFIWSPDSGSLELMPSVDYNFSGNLVLKLSYSGAIDLSDKGFNEVTALPVKHTITAGLSYSF